MNSPNLALASSLLDLYLNRAKHVLHFLLLHILSLEDLVVLKLLLPKTVATTTTIMMEKRKVKPCDSLLNAMINRFYAATFTRFNLRLIFASTT